jgi:N-acetylmuramoyl-L-alanine amidase
MFSWRPFLKSLEITGCIVLALSCSGPSSWQNQVPATASQVTPYALYKEVNTRIDLIPRGVGGRKKHRPMSPRYITIHSTQNTTGDAYNHALALKRGRLNASWHFTVQDNVAIQHMPTRQQGRHADMEGPGNYYSIGIEMCEHRGNNRAQTVERTAKLAAYLMYIHRIPLHNVVPHYHWPRAGYKPPNKNCPHFLLDNGRPGRTWRWFLSRVQLHYQRLIPGPIVTT